MARKRKALPTPKGEANESLIHAKAILSELKQITDPNATEKFVHRLNDFLRAARTVPEFLSKEPRGSSRRIYTPAARGVPFMRSWINGFSQKLPSDARERLDLLTQLREVSSHDLSLRPALGAISVEVFDSRTGAGRAAIHGNPVYQHDFGSPGAENVIQSTKTSVKYFLADRKSEDVVAFCEELVTMLEKMVEEAYKAFS